MEYKDALIKLENLVADSESLDMIKNCYSKDNFFRITKISNTEIRHSNFLAWILNPKESHGLGDAVLKSIIKNIYLINRESFVSYSLIDLDLLDYSDVAIEREKENIDILIDFHSDKCVFLFENKTKTTDHDFQLNAYHSKVEKRFGDYKEKIFIYLTPVGEEPTQEHSDDWICLGYDVICKSIESALVNSNINEKINIIINDYLEVVREDVMDENGKIKDLCLKVYREHKEAIDLINEYIDVQNDVHQAISDKLKNDNELDLVFGHETSTYLRFIPKSIYEIIGPRGSKDWGKEHRHLLLFEIVTNKNVNQLRISLVLGPSGESESPLLRQKIIDALKKDKRFKIPKALTSKFTTTFNHILVNKTKMEKMSPDEIAEETATYLHSKDFKELVECLCGLLKNIDY